MEGVFNKLREETTKTIEVLSEYIKDSKKLDVK
jgi:hypothetical protein